jgi:hypothetical protein
LLALLSLLALAASAPALAQAPAPPSFQGGTVYGGGQIGKRFASQKIRFVSIRVSPERSLLRFYAEFDVACAGLPQGALASRIKEVPLTSDGSFAGDEEYVDAGDVATQQGTWQFRGRFRERDVARGTVRFRFTLHLNDGRSFQCDSGVVRWTVRDPLRAPGSGVLRRAGAYFGHSAKPIPLPKFAPLLLRVSRDRERVAVMAFIQEVRCRDNREHSVGPALGNFPISRRRHSFGGTASYSNRFGGQTERITVTIRGRFTRRRASGHLRVKTRIVRDGRQIDECDSGRLRWAAESAGRG